MKYSQNQSQIPFSYDNNCPSASVRYILHYARPITYANHQIRDNTQYCLREDSFSRIAARRIREIHCSNDDTDVL